jgi:Ser-tRNA(Ala) deacylase AlaX
VMDGIEEEGWQGWSCRWKEKFILLSSFFLHSVQALFFHYLTLSGPKLNFIWKANPYPGRFNPSTTTIPPAFHPGQEITQIINGAQRDLFSRLHTAGHILGLAINALCREGVIPPLLESKASHYPGSASVEFIGLIDGKHKQAIQEKTDEFVQSAAEVLIHWWPMDRLLTDCTGVTEGFKLPEGETMGRVVEMVGMGAYPCGGTHVENCSLVGKVDVRKISRSKGVSRVSYSVL